MKKLCTVICLSIGLMLLLMTAAVAYQTYSSDDVQVVFAENSVFSVQEKELIEKHFCGDTDNGETYGLRCTLFGHDYKTEYVDVIRHKVRSTRPRCIDDLYETKICTVCSDTVSTLVSSKSIDCCQ